ncbi:unnamed protein product [Rotaria magnacalcarata]|uniref:Uncharacterized protein n=2 Tax=Rotaria magnacalcarata TaxID=392030 RepID=A0A816QYX5_9BILA|nr:unnamed protein product [Rotaria magnacalcarata]
MVFKLSSSHKLTNDRYPVVYRNNVRFARPPPSNSSRSPSAEKLIVEFMEKAWELPKPNLVISVTGRMERFKWPSLRARYDFQRGLIAAANATNYKDLTQEQTEIIPCENKHQHILRPWRSNTFADRTRRPLGKALNIDEIIMKSPLASQNITNYKQLKKIYRNHSIMPNTKSDSLSLAPNHTHFVLLDNIKMNSTNNQTPYGGVNTTIDLRVEIEYQIKETFKVPMIHILADDDALAAATICTALEHDLPVILIEGTGRAVNKFAEWYRSLYGDKLMNPQVYRSDDIYEEAQNSNFETFKQKVQNENQPDVINTLEKEKFLEALMSKKGYKLIWIIQFINDQGRTKLDEVIFYALFNATSMIRSGEVREVQEFKLAMAWNKFDHIQPNLFIDRNKFKWTNEQLDEELACAISTNKVRFTDLLVKQGASFNRLRTKMQFEKLYNDVDSKDFLPLLKDYLRNDVDNESDLPKLRQFNSAYELNPQQNEHSESFRCQNNLNHCDETPHKTSATAFNCVFNDTDMIQENGLIDSISIQYNEYLPEDSPIVPICWLVSSTNKPGVVVLVRKTQPLLQVKKTNSFVDYAFPSTEKLYVTTGQYLAFIFLDKKYFPVKVTGKNQYCGQLTWYSNNGEEIEIVEKKDQGVGINFVVNPLPDFVHDFFLWSLFADHHKMATYLCSRSTNSIASALFASKIYHQAAEITLEHEKRLQYRQREREFAEHASNIIDKCFTEGEQFALDMLHMESASHQNYSAWKLAKVIDSRVFLATRTVQRNLDYKCYATTTYALISTAKQVTWKKTTDGSLSHEYSLMNNGTGLWNWNVLGGVIHWGVWKVYGEVQLNDEDNPFFKPGEISNDAYGIITFIITIVFVCVSNILLMNVLIALFNITIQNVERDVHETLGYHRFRLVLEYSKKSHLPPPLNVLIYIFYPLVRRIVKALNKREYGIHNVDDNLDIDSNLFNRVVFNYKDCIQTSNGLIKKVTIQFSPLHSIGESPVAAYILSPEKQNSSTFRIRDKTRFRHDNLGGVGTRRMTFDTPLTCYEGDVLALEFSSKSRIPVCVRDRNEYSTSSEYFHEAEKQGPIKFDNYPSFGAAFSFIVENSTEDEEKTNQEVEMTGINDQLIRSKQPNKSRSFSRKKAMTHTDTSNSSNSSNSIHTQFEKNDIIFRASSIAEDYWRSKIEEIKRQEAQLADEDTHLIVSSSVSNFQN